MTARTVGITGAYGYVGRLLAEAYRADGDRVVALVRSPRQGDPDARRYDLGVGPPAGLLADVDLLLHAAYDLRLTSRAEIWQVNVDGTAALLDAAIGSGVERIIVISSMSAYPGTAQLYGQAKLAIEERTIRAGGIAVRCGLVYGPTPGGMAGALRRIARLPVVPVVAGGQRQFPVHEDDVVIAIKALSEMAVPPSLPIGIAPPESVPFKVFLRHLAGPGRRQAYLPVPWQAVYWALRLCERAGVPVPFRSDSLLGLVRPARHVPGADVLTSLGLEVRGLRPDSSPAPASRT